MKKMKKMGKIKNPKSKMIKLKRKKLQKKMNMMNPKKKQIKLKKWKK